MTRFFHLLPPGIPFRLVGVDKTGEVSFLQDGETAEYCPNCKGPTTLDDLVLYMRKLHPSTVRVTIDLALNPLN